MEDYLEELDEIDEIDENENEDDDHLDDDHLEELDDLDFLPETGELVLIVCTCRAILNSYINLNLIANNLKLTENIVGKKMINVITEGDIKIKKNIRSKRIQKKQKKRMDFSNQLTLIVNLYEKYSYQSDKLDNENIYEDIFANVSNENNPYYLKLLNDALIRRQEKNIRNGKPKDFVQLNLKIFGNGKIMITGGLTIEECKKAVMLFQEAAVDLTDYIKIDTSLELNDLFNNVNDYCKFIKNYHLHILKLFTIFEIDVDLHIDLIINKKTSKKYGNYTINEFMNSLLTCSEEHLNKYTKLIQVFKIVHLYYPDKLLLNLLKSDNSFIISLITQLYNGNSIKFPSTFTKDLFIKDPEMSIQNYNTIFGLNYNIDRDQLTININNKYINSDMDPVRFDPSSYQGIKAKYISRIGCDIPNCKSTGSKKSTSKCICKKLSFLIFQNKTIVTGGRHWPQIIDGYNKIKSIIENEYEDIKINDDTKKEKDKLPKEIEINGYLYLNKNILIYENPRNLFILKSLGYI